ncbi:MAG TPA: TadE/TadG family type IV pilus assembly protein [Noviherbaspirillum sp.]|uniref:TadE/TadG family type IV pilus assembly protein n=1 Tax=Noviherbaspirillum sp. TaxID=1926288 RepID=UPI002D36B54E|nr:TadE/TadG family type IV pilus assembly protein [Noviherbaspirillum sp.]HYD95485.1 TadE/TadG family type IV pilus assembly protein [Noviherbaspirillum sp.]
MNKNQNGATTIEFALSLIVFFTFLLGIVDFGRMLFTWSAANEAARVGARYAVVCDDTNNEAQVLRRMQGLLPQIAEIRVVWYAEEGPACTPSTCDGVTVTIVNLDYQWISPIAGLATRIAPVRMPTFSTYLPREMMRQDPNSEALCST